jgi:hypothetical protein
MIGILKFEDGDLGTTFVCSISGDMSAADVGQTLRYLARDKLGAWQLNIEQRARQILMHAGHNPDRPGDFGAPTKDSRLYSAHLILRHLRLLRSAIAGGDTKEAVWQAIQIENIASRHDFAVDHGSAIRRGRAFIAGPKKSRSDALARSIKAALVSLGLNAQATEVCEFLKGNPDFEIDDDGTIFWTADNGRSRMTTFKSLKNRIANLRRSP